MSPPTGDRASRLRQSLSRLRDEIARVLDVFLARDPLVRGSVYELRRKCGKPSCACASGQALHSCIAITWTDGGRKRLRSLSPKEEMELMTLTENYRRFRRARARLVELHAKLIGVVDQLELTRRRKP
jgi:hypothetical protein